MYVYVIQSGKGRKKNGSALKAPSRWNPTSRGLSADRWRSNPSTFNRLPVLRSSLGSSERRLQESLARPASFFADRTTAQKRRRTKLIYKNAQAIASFITEIGIDPSSWRCGVTSDPQKRLFQSHRVNQGAGFWICKNAGSLYGAQQIELYLRSLGCQGPPDRGRRYAYAYLMTPTTRP